MAAGRFHSRVSCLAVILACVAGRPGARPAPAQPPLRYDLAPGDHLVYTERFTRTVSSPSAESESRMEWTSHLLVLDAARGNLVVALQRTRQGAELLRWRGTGRERLEAARARFDAQVRQLPERVAEASWIDASGEALLPWSVLREASSELLPAFHEILPLPRGGATPGTSWVEGTGLGLRMTASPCGAADPPGCLLLEGRSDTAQLSATFDPAQGLVVRQTGSGSYTVVGDTRIREEVTFTLRHRTRGETPAAWLADAGTRQAVLEGWLVASRVGTRIEQLHSLAADPDVETSRRALAVLWRHRLAPPPDPVLSALATSPSPRVRALASRFSRRPPDGSRPPAAPVAEPGSPVSCAAEHSSAARSRTAPGQPPGMTLRGMTTAGLEGWPYTVLVPEEYRGDEPYPLVLYLGGGPGRTVPTAQEVGPAFLASGYLVVVPQSAGMWWSEASTRLVDALLDEVLHTYAVDPDRVFLAGLSNGGTGALHVATRWPHRFAAVAASMAAELGRGVASRARPATLGPLPLLLIHGTKDPVVDVSEAQRNRARFAKEAPDTPLEFVLLAGRGHDIWPGTDEGRTLAFLDGKRRPPMPRHVILEATPPLPARAYWLEIIEGSGSTARLAATLDDAGGIDVTAANVRRFRILLVPGLVPPGARLRVTVNGRTAFEGAAPSDCPGFVQAAARLGDPALAPTGTIDIEVGRAPRD